jgi:hypothetical protein
MALRVYPANTFDASSVVFSSLRKNKSGGKAVYLNGTGGSKLFIEFPFMRAPFGLSSFTDEATKKVSYSLDLSFDKNDDNLLKLQESLKKLDDTVIKMVADNSQEWLGKKYNASVIEQALYKPLIRPGKGDYASTMKLKILMDPKKGTFVPEAYSSARQPVPLDSIEKGQKVKCIIDLNQIWFIDNKFGISARLQQVLLEPSKKLPAFAFTDVPEKGPGSDNEEQFDDEECEVDE